MSDAWGGSFGDAWGVSWTSTATVGQFACGTFDPAAFDTNCPSGIVGGGGIIRDGFPDPYRKPRTDAEIRKQREDWGILPRAAEIIERVAQRQADDLHVDDVQRLQELEFELAANGLQIESNYIQALNAAREYIINAEIGAHLRQIHNSRVAAIITLLLMS